MKRVSLWLATFSLTSQLILTLNVAQAQSTFTFNIMGRGVSSSPPATGPFPTGLFKMTVETAGPVVGPGVTATVSANGGSCTIAAPDCSFTTSNNDLVIAVPDSGNPNNAIIEYYPQSLFAAPGNFCTPTAAQPSTTVLESVTINITGLSTVNNVRGNTYTPATSLDCSEPFVRVDSNPVVFTATPTGQTGIPPRNPLDIVLLLDNSGSMALPSYTPTPAAPYDTRWNVLNQVVDMFLTTWAQSNYVTPANNAVYGSAEDRIGLVFYSTSAEPASYPPSTPGANGIFISRGMSSDPWTPVSSAVAAQGPTNLTAIGLGLVEAICDAEKSTNDPQLILMTDGEQNVVPLLQPDPPMSGTPTTLEFTATPTCPAATMPIDLYSKFIPIQTVALGTPGVVDTQLLNEISKETAGNINMAWVPADIATGFTDTLMDALKGNTLDLNTRAEGTLAANATESAAIPLLLDGSVLRTTMVLGWENQNSALDLQITSPNGTVIQPLARKYTPFWTVQSIDLPASGPSGNWSVKVVRNPNVYAGARTEAVSAPYFLSIYSVEGKLAYKFTFSSLSAGTGNPIGLNAEVSYNGTPLTGLGNAIKVQIQRPNTGLGTVLHNTSVPASVLTTEPTPTDVTTPLQRKVLYLTSNNGLIGTVAPQPIPTQYTLLDQNNTGIYSTVFADTSSPGPYKFNVTMDWNNATTGQIHREETLQVQVPVTPDPTASVVSVTQGKIVGNWSLNVTPIDKYGNYLGPGFVPSFQVAVFGGGSVSGPPADALQTGGYGINLVDVPANADPTVTVTVGGVTIRNCNLSTCAGAGGGLGTVLSKWWWIILLVILLALLLAFLFWRRLRHV